jgi:hypothetical protein
LIPNLAIVLISEVVVNFCVVYSRWGCRPKSSEGTRYHENEPF